MRIHRHLSLCAIATALVIVLPSCQLTDEGSDAGAEDAATGDAGEEELDLDHLAEHACTHFQTGTPEAVTASATADGSTTAVEVGHAVHAVTLVAFEGQQGGYLALTPDEATDIVLFAAADVPLAVEDSGGTTVEVHMTAAEPSTCSAIKKIALYELDAASYFIKLGPTDLGSVELLAEEAHHDD